MRKTLALWKQQGKTVVIAEHRLHFLRELADRILVFCDGEVSRSLDADAFAKLAPEECAEMGLRATNLDSVVFPARNIGGSTEIILKDVNFHYTKESGVDVPSLSLPRGRITAIIGRNGAGKSTLSRTLCGLNRRAKGSVVIDGEEIPLSKTLSRCYMVMQDVNHQLFTDSALEEVQISVSETVPEKLREERACEALRDLGKTILVITHDMELIALCADSVVRLDGGRIAESYLASAESVPRLTSFFLNQPT